MSDYFFHQAKLNPRVARTATPKARLSEGMNEMALLVEGPGILAAGTAGENVEDEEEEEAGVGAMTSRWRGTLMSTF